MSHKQRTYSAVRITSSRVTCVTKRAIGQAHSLELTLQPLARPLQTCLPGLHMRAEALVQRTWQGHFCFLSEASMPHPHTCHVCGRSGLGSGAG